MMLTGFGLRKLIRFFFIETSADGGRGLVVCVRELCAYCSRVFFFFTIKLLKFAVGPPRLYLILCNNCVMVYTALTVSLWPLKLVARLLWWCGLPFHLQV